MNALLEAFNFLQRDCKPPNFEMKPDAQRRIEELMARVETFPDEKARALLMECLHSLLALYGEGLERVLQLVGNAGAEGQKILDALGGDKLVQALLLIHGLHPKSLKERLEGALEKMRPYLQSHGGNVELISLENEVARLRLQGTCKTCPSSSVTLELAVRQGIEAACPDLAGFEVEGVTPGGPAAAPGLVCDENLLVA
jgi:Fe-S cluster biogenesis protein NfuA